MECEICGGTDFYKDSGYFYCNECQTQSQEVREHVFQEENINNVQGVKKVIKDNTTKLNNKITSWECYNIILYLLSKQLITLGANANLKQIVKCLWIRYLQKLEVLDLDRNGRPRLQLVNSKKDLEILYEFPKKRKRRKSTDGSSTSHSNSTRREQSKRKRALVHAHYDALSQKSNQESASLHNETLTSLKSSSGKSEEDDELICFNKYVSIEIRKKMSRKHYRKHRLDKGRNLQCHKFTYKNCSTKYKSSVHSLSPKIIYGILYLGLLINRDKIQLGDLMRYIREGHLNFNNYTDLFPEEYFNKYLNIHNNNKNRLFTNKIFRLTTAGLAHFLNVSSYIKVVNLTALCQRFCQEMNLPDDVNSAVRNIISKSNPKLLFTKKSKIIPNYEGRAMSIIIFTLKLLFGLDGVTEWKMSEYAQMVNNLDVCKTKMFDIIKWLEYIIYRNLLISEHHFPSMYLKNPNEIDSDVFLQYIKSHDIKVNENQKLTKEMTGYKELLTKILQTQKNNFMKFPPTLTPFIEYFDILNCAKYDVTHNFQNNSLDFILRPNKYLQLVSYKTQFKHGGANDDWIIEEKLKSSKKSHVIPVEIIKNDNKEDIDEIVLDSKFNKNLSVEYIQKTFEKYRQHVFHKNEMYLKQMSDKVELSNEVTNDKKSPLYIHYNPYERYWLYLQVIASKYNVNKNDFFSHFSKYTSTFKHIFNECARIIEQSPKDLYDEFQLSELYLVYSASFSKANEKQKKQKLLNNRLLLHIKSAENHW